MHETSNATMGCRFCGMALDWCLIDLGRTPLVNSYVTPSKNGHIHEDVFPLEVRVCPNCFLAQITELLPPDSIFSDYAYFSSYSNSWVAHAARYAEAASERFRLGPHSRVVEVASNDGYLLQHFQARGIGVLGVDPAANVAQAAIAKGIPTHVAFFGIETAEALASRGEAADLMVANNVLAHVPDIGGFVSGFKSLLRPEGVATFEFPHLLNLIEEIQFDTIYHEHFSYLSLLAVEKIFAEAGLRIFDVEEVTTHGGSLRIYACHSTASHEETEAVASVREKERAARLDTPAGYAGFAVKVEATKRSFLEFLTKARREGKKIAGYGAAAKGTSFLNACGVAADDIACVFDRSLAKQGKLLPGCHIPILPPEELSNVRPDYLVILAWNLAEEIRASTLEISNWGGRHIVAVPSTREF